MVPSMTECGSSKKDDVIFAGAGLGFIAVDQHILGLFALLGNEATTSNQWEIRRRRARAGRSPSSR